MSVLAQDVADDRDDDAIVAPTARWRRAARWLRRNPVSAAAIVVIGLLVFIAVFAPVLEPYKPDVPDPMAVLKPPSWAHPLGTDGFGRDVLSRIIDATTLDLSIALAATLVALSIGMVVGALSGYRGGWVDLIVLRLVDVLMAFPAFVLAMGITAALGNSIANVAIALSMTQLPAYIRLVRGEMLRVRTLEYAEAAVSIGNPSWRVALVHLLPNCLPPLTVQATLAMGYAVLTMASLSFIGLGIAPPQSEWGSMTADGATYMSTGEWWLFVFPGVAIVVTVLAFNLVGDALRDLLDPRLRGTR
jgi:peptide/nickel transport system permease protein